MRYFYNFLLYLIFPFIPWRLYWRGRRNPAYLKKWRQRFAHYKEKPFPASIWVHAVSVGEALAAVPLIKALQQRYPKLPIVATTMTPTGAERLQAAFGDKILQVYVPYDYPGAVQRFLNYINPKFLIIMETELWPNILHYTAKRKVPILLANARLSPRSFKGYRYLRFFTKKMLASVNTVAAQSAEDGARFVALGLAPERLLVTGNIKFDLTIPASVREEAEGLLSRWCIARERPIFVAASTHKGEEEKVLSALRKVLVKEPRALLILVPRHPERFAFVAELCQKQGFKILRYSTDNVCDESTQIIVGDVMGKLLLFYALAKVAFVGGSLVPTGGHNLLEPAALGVPILTGPALFNFKEISALLKEAGAAETVNNSDELAAWVLKIFQDINLQTQMAEAGLTVLAQNRGALQKVLQRIGEIIINYGK